MRTLLLATLGAILSAAAIANAEPSPAADRAAAIAPYLDEGTVAVVRVDVTKIDVRQLIDHAVKLVPEAAEELQLANEPLAGMVATFTRAGGKELYLVLTLTELPNDLRVLVVPLAPGANAEQLTALLQSAPMGTCKRIGQSLVVASEAMLRQLGQGEPDARPELAAALEAAGDAPAQVLLLPPKHTRRVVEELLPTLPKEIGGGPSSVLVRGIQWVALGMAQSPELSLRLTIQSQDHDSAVALRAKLVDLAALAGRQEEVRQVMPKFDELVKRLTPEVHDNRLVLSLNESNGAVADLVAAVKVPIAEARRSAARTQSMNNLKQIALAMHMYHDSHKSFPAAASYSPDGKPLLSWRVQLLPYLEQEALYKQFRLNEPWDSPHNRPLIDHMPPVFRSPLSQAKSKTLTTYLAPVGPQTVFPGKEPVSIKDITDGTSNTIMIVESDDGHGVTWTQPQDLAVDPQQPAQGLPAAGFNAAWCDGSVRFLTLPRDATDLWPLFTRAGGEPVNPNP